MSTREAALAAASSAPLFSQSRSTASAQRYPFVFDSYADARQSSSFIAGSKVVFFCTDTVITYCNYCWHNVSYSVKYRDIGGVSYTYSDTLSLDYYSCSVRLL